MKFVQKNWVVLLSLTTDKNKKNTKNRWDKKLNGANITISIILFQVVHVFKWSSVEINTYIKLIFLACSFQTFERWLWHRPPYQQCTNITPEMESPLVCPITKRISLLITRISLFIVGRFIIFAFQELTGEIDWEKWGQLD